MVRQDQILTKEGIILNIGDSVQITEGNKNWNKDMNKFVGEIVTITKIYDSDSIKFYNSGMWCWQYCNGHFKPIFNKIYELW